MLRHDVLRHGLILTVHHVHVKLALAALDNGAQLGGTLNASVEGFEENAAKKFRFYCLVPSRDSRLTHSLCHS